MTVTSYPSVIVSVNFFVVVVDGRRGITVDKARDSNRVNSEVSFFSPFCGMRNRRRHGANLRPIVRPAIVGPMKGTFKSLFLLNCFASAFQRSIFSPSLAQDNQWG